MDEISEMELTTTFIDPILSPLFHNPEKNKEFIWLNRKEENSCTSRPNGVMKSYIEKSQSVALGYCEVKTCDAKNKQNLLCKDLLRLGEFAMAIMNRKKNNVSCCLQAVVQHVSFYITSMIAPTISVMNEVFEFDVPMEIKQLSGFASYVDQLKQIMDVYENHRETQYIHNMDDTNNVGELQIKPNKRKRSTDKKIITFTVKPGY